MEEANIKASEYKAFRFGSGYVIAGSARAEKAGINEIIVDGSAHIKETGYKQLLLCNVKLKMQETSNVVLERYIFSNDGITVISVARSILMVIVTDTFTFFHIFLNNIVILIVWLLLIPFLFVSSLSSPSVDP